MSDKIIISEYEDFRERIKRCSAELLSITSDKPISRFIHPSIGHELAAFTVTKLLPKGTQYALYYRCHAWALALGCTEEQLIHDIMACSEGKMGALGSMHCLPHPHIIDCNSVVGAQIPISIGAAIVAKQHYARVVCVLGDGATNCGAFFEGLNVASVLNLPLIFVVEDNKIAINTSYDRTSKISPQEKFNSMGIPVVVLKNLSVVEVLSQTRSFIQSIKNGPIALIFENEKPPAHMLSEMNRTNNYEQVSL